MKDHPYYNRPSLESSYKIAVIFLIALIILVLGIIVSESIVDFDNTYNKMELDPSLDTINKTEINAKTGLIV